MATSLNIGQPSTDRLEENHNQAAARHFATAEHHLQESHDHALAAARHQRQAARHHVLGLQEDLDA